ncbi:MAG: glucose-6-phosphate isomerase family protein [Candidatus Dojkabacteria bacterium]
MIDLSSLCGFSLKIDEARGRVIFGDDVNCKCEQFVSLQEIIPVLLNKQLKYPENVYKEHKSLYERGDQKGNSISYDLLYIPYGLLGIEFIKTHIYQSKFVEAKYHCMVELLSGEMMVVMQRNAEKEDVFQMETYVDDMVIVKLIPGEKVAIPTGYMYTFVNVGLAPVVFAKISTRDQTPMDYASLRRERGLAYYIISKNAKVEAVANPKYKINCSLKNMSLKKLLKDEDLKHTYSPFEADTNLFNYMRNNDSIEELIFF